MCRLRKHVISILIPPDKLWSWQKFHDLCETSLCWCLASFQILLFVRKLRKYEAFRNTTNNGKLTIFLECGKTSEYSGAFLGCSLGLLLSSLKVSRNIDEYS